MNSKNKILSAVAALGLCAFAFNAPAVLPTYKTFSAAGTAAAPATIIFPDDPNSQIRIVTIYAQSDTNNAQLQFTTGGTAIWQTATNAGASAVTNLVNSTNGLVPGSVLVLNHGGTMYSATLSSFNQNATNGNGTNIVLNSGGWGVATSAGDNIYQMSATNTINVGNTTNSQNGDAIYVGNYGRPVMLRLTPALVTNALPAASAHYDSASQY